MIYIDDQINPGVAEKVFLDDTRIKFFVESPSNNLTFADIHNSSLFISESIALNTVELGSPMNIEFKSESGVYSQPNSSYNMIYVDRYVTGVPERIDAFYIKLIMYDSTSYAVESSPYIAVYADQGDRTCHFQYFASGDAISATVSSDFTIPSGKYDVRFLFWVVTNAQEPGEVPDFNIAFAYTTDSVIGQEQWNLLYPAKVGNSVSSKRYNYQSFMANTEHPVRQSVVPYKKNATDSLSFSRIKIGCCLDDEQTAPPILTYKDAGNASVESQMSVAPDGMLVFPHLAMPT